MRERRNSQNFSKEWWGGPGGPEPNLYRRTGDTPYYLEGHPKERENPFHRGL